MGRVPRIEYEGAVYHVMCRGDRGEPIFSDDRDHKLFLDTLAEACGRTGWRVHAFVLMGNHYHILLETPEANLSDGMRWLQGTYTKRYNIRHNQFGHLFQGRYKAVVVDPGGDYFSTLASYIHLNPARAKCFDLERETLEQYRWSSYLLYLQPSKRPNWLCVNRTLGNLALLDNSAGRDTYRGIMQKRVVEIACSENPWEADKRWADIRKGWCVGGDEFRSRMVEALDNVLKEKRRDSFVGEETQKHDALEAQRLLDLGLQKLGIPGSELSKLKKSDPQKKAIAWLIRKNTSVKNEWIAKALQMGCVSNMSQFVREVEEAGSGSLFNLKETLK